MTIADIIKYRLLNQHIAETHFTTPQQLVAYMGAMQAQDFAMAKWALGLRLPGITNTIVEKAFNDGEILRTHIMRPTWHFVAPADIRWMQSLTAYRVVAILKHYYKLFELTDSVRKRSKDIFIKALQGGKFLTRDELKLELKKAKIIAERERLAHIVMDAELHNIICSGPRIGKQFTYALLDERAPKAKFLPHEEALAELTTRYFTSRGPATIKDYMWWSGLTMAEAKKGIAMLGKKFITERIGNDDYIFIPTANTLSKNAQTTFLLPDYDEYGISYKDRSAIYSITNAKGPSRGGNSIFNHMIVVNGRLEGTWRATVKKRTVSVETVPFIPLNKSQQQKLDKAINRYTQFFMS